MKFWVLDADNNGADGWHDFKEEREAKSESDAAQGYAHELMDELNDGQMFNIIVADNPDGYSARCLSLRMTVTVRFDYKSEKRIKIPAKVEEG